MFFEFSMGKEILKLQIDAIGIINDRPNRFLGFVDIFDIKTNEIINQNEKVHIHDPGRLKEILYPGNKVLLKQIPNDVKPVRKTNWDVIAGWVADQWVLIHSGYHRQIAEAILKGGILDLFKDLETIHPEVKMGKSRIDFLITTVNGKKTYLEVKGCTLTENGVALFPDAPTSRGARHLEELIRVKKQGDYAAVLILIFRTDSKCFAPNENTDPQFTQVFKSAIKNGIKIIPVVLKYDSGKIFFKKRIPVCSNFVNE